MKYTIILFVLTAGLIMAGCNAKGVPVGLSDACSMDYDKKYVEVSGFLDDKGGIFCSNIGGGDVKCGFKLLESPGAEKSMSADIVQGTWANNVEKIERGYKKEDIKIHDNSGNIINMAEKVKLTGTMMNTPDRTVCLVKVDKIEKGQ